MEADKIQQIILNTIETSLELQLRAVRRMKGEDEEEPVLRRRTGKRNQSIVDLSVKILTDSDKPLHVSEICQILLKQYGRVTDRDSLSSALGKKARQGIFVGQSAPATFNLLSREEQQ